MPGMNATRLTTSIEIVGARLISTKGATYRSPGQRPGFPAFNDRKANPARLYTPRPPAAPAPISVTRLPR
jgi:hypothetical protein